MKIYSYDRDTGELRGTSYARIDPMETLKARDHDPCADDVYLMPGLATAIAPPQAGQNEVAVFKGGAWSIEKDHRGEEWYSSEGGCVQIDFIGDPASQGLLRSASEMPIGVARKNKIASLREHCSVVMTGGFVSSATGLERYYPSDTHSQANLVQAIVCNGENETPIWCAHGGVWDFISHRKSQLQALLFDLRTMVMTNQQKLKTLTDAVAAAETNEAIESVVW